MTVLQTSIILDADSFFFQKGFKDAIQYQKFHSFIPKWKTEIPLRQVLSDIFDRTVKNSSVQFLDKAISDLSKPRMFAASLYDNKRFMETVTSIVCKADI